MATVEIAIKAMIRMEARPVIDATSARRKPTSAQWISAVIASLLVVPIAAVALATAVGMVDLPFELAVVDERLPVVFRIHMAAAAMALLLVPAAIAVRRHAALHRPVGRAAALAIVIAGTTALPVAGASMASPLARAGFTAQALAWLMLVCLAYVAIRRRKVQRHRALMLMVAAVTSAAIWLRPAMTLAGRTDWDFPTAYAAIVWSSWLIPLALVAAYLRVSRN